MSDRIELVMSTLEFSGKGRAEKRALRFTALHSAPRFISLTKMKEKVKDITHLTNIKLISPILNNASRKLL